MPCPHNEITIVRRSQRQSAVAAAAYQSSEKLFCEYDQQVKFYPEKRGIVHNEILLPPNAPQEYADRNTLWNAAEAVEKQWNSQLARRWVLTIPREIPPDQYAVLVREFCQKQFVSKGMIADFAIHDPHPPGHNPHAHVLLTMRAMDEHGKWLPKSRKVYDLDENGERIKLPSGRWKSHKEDTVDWNDQKYCEIWRHEWEVIQNRYLEANDRPERVDLRSYARQGLDIVPTVHEGAAVRQMEKRGIQTNIGNLNREIRAANSLMQSIRQLIQNLKSWITELGEKRKELLAQKAAEEAVFLPNLLMKYMEIRKEERNRYKKQKKKVARIHTHIAHQRKDFLHKESRKIANSYDIVCMEDLNMKEISQDMCFGKSVHDNSRGMFTDFLAYKMERAGKKRVRIDRWYPSSKTCSCCGNVKKDLQLSDRIYECVCGNRMNRDENAAINICREGIRISGMMPDIEKKIS